MDDAGLKIFLRGFLRDRRYIVYPSEIFVGDRLLDIAAFKNYFYAFECKSYGDRIKFPQLENYAKYFDYVILVSEKMHPRLEKKFKNMGYGFWLLESEEEGIVEIVKPSIQHPSESCRRQIEQKFKRIAGYRRLKERFTPKDVFIPSFYITTLEDYQSNYPI
jgi:hypothetical protein